MYSLRSSLSRQVLATPLCSRAVSRSLATSTGSKKQNIASVAKEKLSGQPQKRDWGPRFPSIINRQAPPPPFVEPADGKQRVGYVLHCKFTPNNSILTLTSKYVRVGKRYEKLTDEQRYMDLVRPLEDVRINLTAGILGFRNTKQGEYEAGFQTAARMFTLMSERNFLDRPLEIILSNFGKGREAFLNALNGAEGNAIRKHVVRVTDGTKIRIGGPRPPRARRV